MRRRRSAKTIFPATSGLSPLTRHNQVDTKVKYYGLRNQQEDMGYEEEYIVEASKGKHAFFHQHKPGTEDFYKFLLASCLFRVMEKSYRGASSLSLTLTFPASGGILGKGAIEKKKPKACENHIVYFLTKRSFYFVN